MKKLLTTSTIVAAAMTLAACQSAPTVDSVSPQPVLVSHINTIGAQPTHLGNMYLRPVESGIQVFGSLGGFVPGSTVAIHIHQTGSCKAMGKAAGGHFNPLNKPHGNPNNPDSHAGDLPNATADENGIVSVNFVRDDISVNLSDPLSVYRRAFVVHGGADDYTSQPSGNSGERIACGIIVAH